MAVRIADAAMVADATAVAAARAALDAVDPVAAAPRAGADLFYILRNVGLMQKQEQLLYVKRQLRIPPESPWICSSYSGLASL